MLKDNNLWKTLADRLEDVGCKIMWFERGTQLGIGPNATTIASAEGHSDHERDKLLRSAIQDGIVVYRDFIQGDNEKTENVDVIGEPTITEL
ncbi:hypothetical protein [Candidatus Tisiphia endosymbiont of Sialis lutaria]|uniref:hypothetical protein n=1 Tax=Candidatus Tisiphia endosymbiont of Sialis lutaria TaxID=2029164 RepID=UPI00312C73D7